MSKILQVMVLVGLAQLSITVTLAKTDVSLRVEGGVSGYGGALLYHLHPLVNLALGYNGDDIKWGNKLHIAGVNANLNVENDVTFLNANIYPWGKRDNRWLNSLYTSIGIGYVDHKYNINHNYKKGEKLPGKLNNIQFLKEREINAQGYIDYASGISPYLGLGFSPQLTTHWGVFTELGVYYVGSATAHVTHVNNIDIGFLPPKYTAYKMGSNNLIAWSPVAKFGLTYRF